MGENFAYWSASFQRAGKWFYSSPALGTYVVANITDRLSSEMSCYQDHIICHPSTYSRPTWWTHNPKFHRIETWLSCTSLTPKYPLHLAHMEFPSHRSMDWSLLGPDVIQHAKDQVRINYDNLKAAQSRQKSQYDRHHQDIEIKSSNKSFQI